MELTAAREPAQAGIAAVHAEAGDLALTDWSAIVALDDLLRRGGHHRWWR